MPAVTFDGAVVERTSHLRYFEIHFDRKLDGSSRDAMLQVCHLTELKQTKAGKVLKPLGVSMRQLLPEKLGKHCREWPAGKTESEIKLLCQENNKLRDPIMYLSSPDPIISPGLL